MPSSFAVPQVDEETEFDGLLDGQLGGLGAQTAIPRHVPCPAQRIREDMVSPSPTSSFVYLEFFT
jgi:hypothetical protein